MAYRFTNTEKWTDSWFSNLSQIQMLLFMYLCDNCDIAGFIEINYKRWANDLNSSQDTIEGACKGLVRGLKYSNTNDCIFIINFLKHQKNLPLNENNKAHIGILKRFELYKQKFEVQTINELIEGGSKGLQSPTGIGIGIGNGIDNGKKENKIEFNFGNIKKELWEKWIQYKKDQFKFKYKSESSEQIGINNLIKLSGNDNKIAEEIINQTIANGWEGLFPLKNNGNAVNIPVIQESKEEKLRKTKEIFDKLMEKDYANQKH